MSLERACDLNELLHKKDFQIEKQIGKGSFAYIYKGILNNQEVAIKAMHHFKKSKLSDFKKEASYMAFFSAKDKAHYLVGYRGSVTDHLSYYWLVMEYMPNGNLSDFLLNPKNMLTLEKAYEHMVNITKGVKFLHDYDILHRDIKCINVLLTAKFVAKLGDFGSAADVGARDNKTSSLYMAPELIEVMIGGEVDSYPNSKKSDIFSLAVTFLEILRRKIPFENLTLFGAMQAVREKKRDSIPDYCPIELGKLITRGWNHDPAKRPSAEELLSKLTFLSSKHIAESWSTGKSVTIPAPSL